MQAPPPQLDPAPEALDPACSRDQVWSRKGEAQQPRPKQRRPHALAQHAAASLPIDQLSAEQLQGPPMPAKGAAAATLAAAAGAAGVATSPFVLLLLPPSAQTGGTTGARGPAGPRGGSSSNQGGSIRPLQSPALSEHAPPPTLQLPPDWAAAIACVCESAAAMVDAQGSGAVGCAAQHTQPPVVAVAGARGVGKSSLARFLVNHLLNVYPVVAYLVRASCSCKLLMWHVCHAVMLHVNATCLVCLLVSRGPYLVSAAAACVLPWVRAGHCALGSLSAKARTSLCVAG